MLENEELFQINIAPVDIENLILDSKRINFVDPLYMLEGWGEVDNVMRRLKSQLDGGLCFIAMHLKTAPQGSEIGEMFGSASAFKVPSVVLYFHHKEGNRFKPEFIIKKIRNWKSGKTLKKIQCKWDDEKGLIPPKDLFGGEHYDRVRDPNYWRNK